MCNGYYSKVTTVLHSIARAQVTGPAVNKLSEIVLMACEHVEIARSRRVFHWPTVQYDYPVAR